MAQETFPEPKAGPDDAALLAHFAAGDPRAAAVLVDRLMPGLLRYATRLLNHRAEAEEVTQETLLRLWQVAGQWRSGEAQPKTWAYRVAGNLCTDRLRARRFAALPLDAAPDPADTGQSALAGLIEADRTQALAQALMLLPERQRQAVVLRHIEGLSNPQIAAILQIGVEAVESLISRGKRALEAALSGQKGSLGYEDEE